MSAFGDCSHPPVFRREQSRWAADDPRNLTGRLLRLEQCEQCRRLLMIGPGGEVIPAASSNVLTAATAA
jgi:LSD1 subclass zinc finger protein